MIALLWPLRGLQRLFRWLSGVYYEHRPPPWMEIGHCDPLSDAPGEHSISFASRHDIAECGLKCQKCDKIAAGRGDYKYVRRTRLGEAVKCPGCGEILVAAPDTEHGDDLLPYDKDRFHRFVRISEAQAVRERYGADMGGSMDQLTAAKKRFSMREEAAPLDGPTDAEKALFRQGIAWNDLEPDQDPYHPEGPQAVHIGGRPKEP